MEFVNIANRFITVMLSPEEARRLAAACDAASDVCCGSSRTYGDLLPTEGPTAWLVADMFEAMASAFEAAALAAAVDSYILDNKLTLENMRDGKVTDPLWPVPREAQPVT